MSGVGGFRVATYNIHKCQGFDRRILPERIIEIIRELGADVLCLQEVVHAPDGAPVHDQAGAIARALPEYTWHFGANRELHGGVYGNMTLSRLRVVDAENLDITKPGREPRGVLQTDVQAGSGRRVHVFNVHLGTGFMERRFQAELLLGERVLGRAGLSGPRLVLGDFNEWTRGLTTRLLRSSFETFQPRHGMKVPRTFPGMLPLITLDHCYYEPPLQLRGTRLWRTATALVASDHLPLVADFELADAGGEEARTSD